MNIKSTTYPPVQLSEQEWMDEFRVSTLVPKYDGIDRAREMMRAFEDGKIGRESIWQVLMKSLSFKYGWHIQDNKSKW